MSSPYIGRDFTAPTLSVTVGRLYEPLRRLPSSRENVRSDLLKTKLPDEVVRQPTRGEITSVLALEPRKRWNTRLDPNARPRRIGESRSTAPSGAGTKEKLDFELAAFESLLRDGELSQYRGCYVAIHRGRVFGSDIDELVLARRVVSVGMREGAIAIQKVADHAQGQTPEVESILPPHFGSPIAG